MPFEMSSIARVTLTAAGVWFLLGYRTAFQVYLVAAVSYIATGKRYRWIRIIQKTLPRDLKALVSLVKMRFIMWRWDRKGYTIAKIFSKEIVPRNLKRVAIQFEDQAWTYEQVEEYSNRVANYFKNQGFNHGDTVALFMENRPEYVCIWLGLSKIGVVIALINFNLRRQPLIHSITVAKCQALIYGAEVSEAVKEIVESLNDMPLYESGGDLDDVNIIGTKKLDEAIKSFPTSVPNEIDMVSPQDKLIYIYTSGTTGLPKAAVVTSMRYVFQALALNIMLKIRKDDVLYDPLPLYHSAGGVLGIGQMLIGGVTVVLRKKFSASNFWTDCVKYNCTVAQYIGEICRYLLSVPKKPEETQHCIRLMCGNGLRPQIWREFVKRFNIKQIGEFYGATEGNANLVNNDNTVGAVGFVPRYAGSIYPVQLIKIDEDTGEPIRGPDGLCVACQAGESGMIVGRIISRIPMSSFLGYADKKASERKIIQNVFSVGDSAFVSGDILEMDELGYFYFKDRTGDTFRWKGENVATSEVEAVISNVIGLKDAVVYGVEIPNLEGRAGMAAIVDEDNSLDMKSLAEGIKKDLPSYARPVFIRVMNELPLTGTYKLKKRDLQVEGYNRTKIKDKLFIMDKTGYYTELTEQVYSDLMDGKVRL